MTAFAAAIDSLFANPHLAQDAVYTPAGGTAFPVRVIARRPDVVSDFAGAGITSATALFDLRVSEVAAPRPGDRIKLDGDAFVIEGEHRRRGARLVEGAGDSRRPCAWRADPLALRLLACDSDAGGGGRAARRRVTPVAWERWTVMRLRFVYRRTGPSLLVTDNVRISNSWRVRANVTRRRDGTLVSRVKGRASAVIFLLVPQVRLRKRFDLEGAAREAEARLPGLIVANWPEERPS